MLVYKAILVEEPQWFFRVRCFSENGVSVCNGRELCKEGTGASLGTSVTVQL